MGDEGSFECSDCGTDFHFGAERCPGCGAEVEWDGVELGEVGTGYVGLPDPRLPSHEGEPGAPHRLFSAYGLLCAVLTVAAFSATLVVMRWDTWVRGEAVDSIGDSQRTLVYAGAVATTVLALLTIYDLLRTSSREAARG